jgi:hypothetical protein
MALNQAYQDAIGPLGDPEPKAQPAEVEVSIACVDALHALD